jgi:hypothetical protein
MSYDWKRYLILCCHLYEYEEEDTCMSYDWKRYLILCCHLYICMYTWIYVYIYIYI